MFHENGLSDQGPRTIAISRVVPSDHAYVGLEYIWNQICAVAPGLNHRNGCSKSHTNLMVPWFKLCMAIDRFGPCNQPHPHVVMRMATSQNFWNAIAQHRIQNPTIINFVMNICVASDCVTVRRLSDSVRPLWTLSAWPQAYLV